MGGPAWLQEVVTSDSISPLLECQIKSPTYMHLVIREMHIKRTLRFYLICIRMSKIKTQATAHTGEDMEQGEQSSIAGGIEILYKHAGDQSGGFSENLE